QVVWAAWMLATALATLFYVPPADGFANPEAARMVIFHVPCAMLAVVAYIVSTVYAIAYLAKGNIALDVKSAVSARLGFAFTVLATISGMIFAKVEWGAAWNWDPRETSILMLMIVYAAYFALRSAVPGSAARARVSAVYNILACVVMPYLVFVLPRVLGGLHPTDTLSHRGGLGPEYRIAMAAVAVGFLWLYIWLFRTGIRKPIGKSRK
ncbi:MAG: cytochrome c biogenesis protein, partial [Armatimonadota bacterium]